MSKFLDSTGLSHLISKIDETFVEKTDTQEVSEIGIDEVSEVETQDVRCIDIEETEEIDTKEVALVDVESVEKVDTTEVSVIDTQSIELADVLEASLIDTENVTVVPVDIIPEEGSDNLITSGGVWAGLMAKQNSTNIVWADLKALRDSGGLDSGRVYRITDYTCTTTQTDTASGEHNFDILVIADTPTTLSENARACLHSDDDSYFANSNLGAWELKYCLDNDSSRFSWADSVNGKGVIWWMKDEHNNEGPYDFKNIQYIVNKNFTLGLVESSSSAETYTYRYKYSDTGDTEISNNTTYYKYNRTETDIMGPPTPSIFYVTETTLATNMTIYSSPGTVWDGNLVGMSWRYGIVEFNNISANFYTFGRQQDYSNNAIGINVYNNKISPYFNYNLMTLPHIYFGTTYYSITNNYFGTNCHDIILETGGENNSFGSSCSNMTFSNIITRCSFGASCWQITMVNGDFIKFNNNCSNIHINSYSFGLIFDNNCSSIQLEGSVQNCHFKSGCTSITTGRMDSCYFGERCSNIKFGNSSEIKNNYKNITVERGNQNIYLYCSGTTSTSNTYQNVLIASGTNNTYTWKTITDSNVGQTFKTTYQPANSQTISVE